MKYIDVLVGIPCSGKSTWAQYQQEIQGGIVVISRDDIRKEWWRKYVQNRDNENEVTKIFNNRFKISTDRGVDIILDNCHCKESYINEWIARKPKDYTLRVIFFDIPLWKANLRNIIRYVGTGKWIPFKVIKNMKSNYDKINRSKYEYLLHI